MKEGYIKEIFSSFQGEGPYVGKRQIFIRFAGCPFRCFYCDTSYARDPTPSFCKVILSNLSLKNGDCKENFFENPMPLQLVMNCVKNLITPDLHSISYTGGEPLLSADFVKEIAKETKIRMGLTNFIETNGYSARAFASLADYFDYASIDIKLRNHRAVEEEDYEGLYGNELECIRISVDRGIETIVKVVVIKDTSKKEMEEICKDLSGLNIKFVLQPVTATLHPNNANAAEGSMSMNIVPSVADLFELSEIAGVFLHQKVMVIPQVHKLMKIY